ncbi:aminoglycoside nucleotidyltransferase ANT9 [Sinorhizobium arboris]|uniref:aminoglycoside nucleotidyltransferase ANT9 n=1 Tax=Sinorhizobium arboris TaxID=76745 RepID=UPI000421CBC9|nr:aminoglycoside nucleotidyltransferase ANT9 [Sinorhizobium arboris]
MRTDGPKQIGQALAAAETIRSILQDALLAVYLHGSAVSGGLRPQSDVDLLAIVDVPISDDERRDLLAALLRISGRHPRPAGAPRCIELMVFRRADIAAPCFPVRAEFIYGEWLRDAYESGELPAPVIEPENTLVLAQARQEAVSLFGPDARELLPSVPPQQIRRAMRDALPSLIDSLHGDERNVLLTLARMWRTSATGDFITKDAAASWAATRMPREQADTLIYAREAYMGKVNDDWENRRNASAQTAAFLRQRVSELL